MLYQVMMVVGCIILASGEVAARGVSLQGRIEDAAKRCVPAPGIGAGREAR